MEQEQRDARVAAPDRRIRTLDGHCFLSAHLAKRLQAPETSLWTHFSQGLPMTYMWQSHASPPRNMVVWLG
jgi:hypothetical protein